MKCLKINEGKGHFSLNGTDYKEIDAISKEDIINMLDTALDEKSSMEMDPYDESLLANPAHKVIYKNLFDKFTALNANKALFTTEVKELYQDTLDKYKQS